MAGELEQPEDPDDREELEDVGVLDVRHVLLEEEVGVEADGGHVVDHVHRGLQKVTLVRTGDEPAVRHGIRSIFIIFVLNFQILLNILSTG